MDYVRPPFLDLGMTSAGQRRQQHRRKKCRGQISSSDAQPGRTDRRNADNEDSEKHSRHPNAPKVVSFKTVHRTS